MEPQTPSTPPADLPQDKAPDTTPTPEAPVAPASSPAPLPELPPEPAAATGPTAVGAPGAKKKRLVMALIAGVAVLILGGASAAAYFGYVVPNKPANVLKAAIGNLGSKDITSQYFDGDLSVEDKKSGSTFSATFDGAADQSGKLTAKVDIDALVARFNLEFRSVDGKSFYFKAGGLDSVAPLLGLGGEEAASFGPLVASLDNQWLEINQNMLKQLGVDMDSGAKLSEADRQKLADLLDQHSFLQFQKDLGDEKIKGTNTHHYQVIVDKTALKDFIKGVKDANIKAVPITSQQLTMVSDALGDADFSKYPVDLWISTDKKMIQQVGMTLSDKDVKVTFRLTFFDYNKPVNVEKPKDAKSVLDMFNQLYGGALSGLMNSGGTEQDDVQQLLHDAENGGISL